MGPWLPRRWQSPGSSRGHHRRPCGGCAGRGLHRSILVMDGGERVGLASALRARLAAAGIEVPDDGGRLERDLALHLERLAALAAAADLGPADPPLTNPGSAPPW